MQEPTHHSASPCKTQDLLDHLVTQNKNRNRSRTLTGAKAWQFDIRFPAANDFSSLRRGCILNRERQKRSRLQATATVTLYHTRSYHCLWVTPFEGLLASTRPCEGQPDALPLVTPLWRTQAQRVLPLPRGRRML